MKEGDAVEAETVNRSCAYVIDGGALIHRVCWFKGSDFKQICESYVSYDRKHYGPSHVVFDGYESQTTKSSEHL